MRRHIVLLTLLLVAAMAADWEPGVRLTDNAYPDYNNWSGQRRVAIDQAGRVHTVWYVMNSDLGTYRFQVYYKRFVPGSGWTADTMISADLYGAGVHCKYPAVTVDSTGRVHAAWGGGATDAAEDRVYVKSCRPEGPGTGGWDELSTELSSSAPAEAKACPNLAATPDGSVHAVWLESQTTIAYRECVDSLWQPEVRLQNPGGYKAYPVVAGGPDDRVHVGWYGRTGSSGFYDVWYKCRTDSTWGPTEEVSRGERHQMYQSLAVNPATGDPHVVWQCYEATNNNRRFVHGWRTGGGWQPRDTLSEPGSEHDQGTGQVAFTPDGRGHAVWAGKCDASPTVNQVRYCERGVNGTWTAPLNVTDTTNARDRPSIVAGSPDAPNDLHMVWADYRFGNSEIFYAHATPSAQFIGELPPSRVTGTPATFVQGSIELDGSGPAMLLDASGRVVERLEPGGNDLARLSPGVYFLRRGPASRAARVILQR